jgi:RNA polymerase sigma factor (TIGR02999 family)
MSDDRPVVPLPPDDEPSPFAGPAAGADAPESLESLLPLVYDELRVLAHRQRRRTDEHATLDTTELVHEVYLKLVGASRLEASGRAHFFALAARAMRQVLTDQARARLSAKRGGGQAPIALSGIVELVAAPGADHTDTLLALDAALARLATLSERQARVVECRFYAGMSFPETAVALGVSEATVKRDWVAAQAWLFRELQGA